MANSETTLAVPTSELVVGVTGIVLLVLLVFAVIFLMRRSRRSRRTLERRVADLEQAGSVNPHS